MSQEQRLQPDEGAVTDGPDPVTELQRLQGVSESVTEGEPTLDEALRDPELFERFVKPYGTLVDNNDELDDTRGDIDAEEVDRLADIARALQRGEL